MENLVRRRESIEMVVRKKSIDKKYKKITEGLSRKDNLRGEERGTRGTAKKSLGSLRMDTSKENI